MIATKKPRQPTEQEIAFERARKYTRLCRQLGLERAALLPEHRNLIEQIGELVPGDGINSQPLVNVYPRHKAEVLALLGRLPQVRALVAAAATVGSHCEHRV